jgi:predicted RNA binding protein YcfA (HicA-like mRNA interferase family)
MGKFPQKQNRPKMKRYISVTDNDWFAFLARQPEIDDWYLSRTRGSHRQYKHSSKPGLITIAGKPGHDLAPGTLNSIFKQAGLK